MMNKLYNYKILYSSVIVFFYFFICSNELTFARRGWQGCCSWHGGITYQCVDGHMLCNDGTLSPSCLCEDPSPLSTMQSPSYPFPYNTKYTFQDWNVNTHVIEGNNNAFIEAYTYYKGSSFRVQYSKKEDYAAGIIKTNSSNLYYINYVFITDMEKFSNGDNVELLYSFNQSNGFRRANILKYSYNNKKIIIFFQPENIQDFHKNCIYGSTITLKLNSSMNVWTRFVLYGFTKSNTAISSVLY